MAYAELECTPHRAPRVLAVHGDVRGGLDACRRVRAATDTTTYTSTGDVASDAPESHANVPGTGYERADRGGSCHPGARHNSASGAHLCPCHAKRSIDGHPIA